MIRVEFHCHTTRSFDGLTSERELAAACAARQINVVTITEHDVLVQRPFSKLRKSGVRVIQGCEFTCREGTHIIGLFLPGRLSLSGRTPAEIVSGIREADGIVYLPHPFKPGTGYFTKYEEDDLLNQVEMMELYNGGFKSDPNFAGIKAVAQRHGIKLVAGSDSHAASHVGHFVCEYDCSPDDDLRHVFRTWNPRLLVDAAAAKPPRQLNQLQSQAGYQWLVRRIPRMVKQPIKALLVKAAAPRGAPKPVSYREIF